jgi:NAD-dependent SIR2 family protein deacetylase
MSEGNWNTVPELQDTLQQLVMMSRNRDIAASGQLRDVACWSCGENVPLAVPDRRGRVVCRDCRQAVRHRPATRSFSTMVPALAGLVQVRRYA